MSFKRVLFYTLLVICIASLAFRACVKTNTPTISANPTALAMPPELVDFVSQAAIEEQLEAAAHGYMSPEGAIVALVSSTGVPIPLQVWRCEQGELINEVTDSFTKAMGNNRSDWPPFTMYFAFESSSLNEATVDLRTWYNMGISESSRGGFAQKIDIGKREDEWVVLTKDTYMYWD